MNKKTVLAFIKKYPMSILLAIIAINLFSIAGSLRTSAKLDSIRLICLEGREVYRTKLKGEYVCNILNH